MLRFDFEEHPLWMTLNELEAQCGAVRAHKDPSDMPSLERIALVTSHLRSYHKQRARITALFTPTMLTQVYEVVSNVHPHLAQRIASGSSSWTLEAATIMERSLEYKGAWPSLFAGPREANKEQTLYEDLLEAQRISVDALGASHKDLLAQIDTFDRRIRDEADGVRGTLNDFIAQGKAIEIQVSSQAERVDSIVKDGLLKIADLKNQNEQSYKEWQDARAADFTNDFTPLHLQVEKDLAESQQSLQSLREAVADYTSLSAAAAANTLSADYEKEASASRLWGGILYGAGILLLAAGSLPLLLSLVPQGGNATELSWTQLAVRLGVGVLAASAATVAIRLGARLVSEAGAVKRMALELRTIGPFLSNVSDRADVDSIRISIIDRTFGRSYVPSSRVEKKEDDVVNVSAVAQLLGAVGRMMNK